MYLWSIDPEGIKLELREGVGEILYPVPNHIQHGELLQLTQLLRKLG